MVLFCGYASVWHTTDYKFASSIFRKKDIQIYLVKIQIS